MQAVQAKVGFPVAAPDALVGLPRREVRLVDLDGSPAALVTYGQGLGGIAVLRAAAGAAADQPQGRHDGAGGLSLPQISINGVRARSSTPRSAPCVRFERGGVGYTVAGSVPPTAAEAAARGL